MNKTAIKNFAIWARNRLIADMKYRAGLLGITEAGIADALPQSTGTTEFYDIGTAEPYAIDREEIRQRNALVQALRKKEEDSDYATAYKYIIEEVAYTWFNRLIAVRFMEVNDYLPSHVRVLSSETGKTEPDLVTNPFDAELDFDSAEEEKIIMLKRDNKIDEVFRLLFIKQCNALNEILPALFEKTSDYTELLLNLSVVDQDGVVYHLVHDIPEEDFDISAGGQVEIIGWLYQYYITEKHEEVIDPLHGKVIAKDDVPAATQLFTTDWVVKYLIDNSLGYYWMERNPESKLNEKLEYLIWKENEVEKIDEHISPDEIKILDPCMGSGHFLVYAFDVLMHIYESAGWSAREAARSILENNIYGLDIDERASQLSYFAVMMKARQYDRRIFTRDIRPNVYAIRESNGINRNHLKYFGTDFNDREKEEAIKQIEGLLNTFTDAKEYGSILNVKVCDWELLRRFTATTDAGGQISFETYGLDETAEKLKDLIEISNIMAQKYEVVVTNPPYMNKYDSKLKEYLFDHFKDFSSDLFSVFMVRNLGFCKENGYAGYMTPNVWMFIVSYQKLREFIIDSKTISSLIQMAKGAFFKEATVDICAFILQNKKSNSYGRYVRLENFKGDMEIQRVKYKEALESFDCQYIYETNQNNFKSIQGSPIAYWVSDTTFKVFTDSKYTVERYAENEGKNVTTKNSKYILSFWEVDRNKIGAFDKKWLPCATGGDYRKWYGNIVNVIDWSPEARHFYKVSPAGRIIREEFWDMSGITWGKISSAASSFRVLDHDQMYQETAIMQSNENDSYYILALLNSKPASHFLDFLSPTVNFQLQDICSIPVPNVDEQTKATIVEKAKLCVSICQSDWDDFELSMNFKTHPLVGKFDTIENAFECWKEKCNTRFHDLKFAEEVINNYFIEAYGFENELTPDVEDKTISVRKANLQREIKSLLSYAVGCMFGRYSLDMENIYNQNDTVYLSDDDGIIPILDEEYTTDDIVSRLCEWLKITYSETMLEDNLDFIANALGRKTNDTSSRSVIRKYFMNDFYKDHCSAFSFGSSGKRPIYWLFDSGKQNGFKALIYLHNYTADTIGNVRVEYLYRMQRTYEAEIGRMQDMIDHGSSNREVSLASKRKEKLQKQLKECREYDEKIGHLALSRIELDLDDGVKVNYRKVQTASDGKFYEILADSKNIMAKK